MYGWKLLLFLLPSLALADTIDGRTDVKIKCYPNTQPIRNPLSYHTQNRNNDVLFYSPKDVKYYKHKFNNDMGDFFIDIPRNYTSEFMQIGLRDGVKAVRFLYLPQRPDYKAYGQAVQVQFVPEMQQYFCRHEYCKKFMKGMEIQQIDYCLSEEIYCGKYGDKDLLNRLDFSEEHGIQGNLMLNINIRCFTLLGMIPPEQRDVSLLSCFRVEKAISHLPSGRKPTAKRAYDEVLKKAIQANAVKQDRFANIINCEKGTRLIPNFPKPEEELDILGQIVKSIYKDVLRFVPVVGPILAKGAEFVEVIIENKDQLDRILFGVKETLKPDEYKDLYDNFKKDLKTGLKFLRRYRKKRSDSNATDTIENIEAKLAHDANHNEDPNFSNRVDNGIPSPEDIDDIMLELSLPHEDYFGEGKNIFDDFL
ncbi:hypothetical protein EC973_007650 [Apophysomyces ossiformis]|uniref:Uncharacterized protein n=1 Tax=Apophysomyces ossiformis TaxID=679940 RepID=A0A8H7BTK8_9FUNG|nr:hypothetical protein EC973_007650 [Apophysomyces ossiformis]